MKQQDYKQQSGKKASEAVKKDGYFLQYVPESKMTEEIVLEAVKESGYVYQCVPESKMTEEICLEAFKQETPVYRYVPENMSKDTSNMIEINGKKLQKR